MGFQWPATSQDSLMNPAAQTPMNSMKWCIFCPKKKKRPNLMHLKMEQMGVENGSRDSGRSSPSAITPKPRWCHCWYRSDTLKLALILFGQWLKLYGEWGRGHTHTLVTSTRASVPIGQENICLCSVWLWCKWEARTYYSTSLNRLFFFRKTDSFPCGENPL